MKLGKSTFRRRIEHYEFDAGIRGCSRVLRRMVKVSAELYYDYFILILYIHVHRTTFPSFFMLYKISFPQLMR